jgi:hypothetical protein
MIARRSCLPAFEFDSIDSADFLSEIEIRDALPAIAPQHHPYTYGLDWKFMLMVTCDSTGTPPKTAGT